MPVGSRLECCAPASPSLLPVLPTTRRVCVLDREADFPDFVVKQCDRCPVVELLVRTKSDRVLAEDKSKEHDLFDRLRKAPAHGRCHLKIRWQRAPPKASKQERKARRTTRRAELTLCYRRVKLVRPVGNLVWPWAVHPAGRDRGRMPRSSGFR